MHGWYTNKINNRCNGGVFGRAGLLALTLFWMFTVERAPAPPWSSFNKTADSLFHHQPLYT